jgi:PAS domain S-box-containing protein
MQISRKSFILTTLATTAVIAGGAIWVATRPAEPFMPHGHCYLWEPALLWTHVSSDVLIGLAYVAISATLAYVLTKARRNLPFEWLIVAFGVFIIACGSTHFLEAWMVWHPDYWVSAVVKVITVAASVTTAVMLPCAVPGILRVMEAARNEVEQRKRLEIEVEQRLAAEGDLRKLKEGLEQSVRERTSALSQANSALTLYETIFKTSAWGVAIVDSVRSLIQLVNPAFAHMHGYEPEQMIGMPMEKTFAPEYISRLPQLVDIINAQDHLMYESVHIRKDGTKFPCMTDVTLVRDPQGLPLYRFGYFQDISSQKRVEEDIRNVVTYARCVLWRAIVTGREGWEKFERGHSKFAWELKVQDEVAAQHFQPLVVPPGVGYSEAWIASRHPEDIPTMEEIAAAAFIDGRGSYSQRFRAFDKFGETVWIREEVAIVPIGPGRWQCTGVCINITDEERLNAQVRQQAELLELTHDAIIVRGIDGEIIYWNSGAEDLYGWQRDEVTGKNIHEILATGKSPGEFTRSLEAQGYWAGQLRHVAKDGRVITVDSRHLLVEREDGKMVVVETNHGIDLLVSAGSLDAANGG